MTQRIIAAEGAGKSDELLRLAAPELLEALEDCVVRLRDWIELDDEEDIEACKRAFAAIRKAKGE
jgi:hypothetical protein